MELMMTISIKMVMMVMMIVMMIVMMAMMMMVVIKREYKSGVEAAGGERRWRVKLDFQEVQLVRHHSLASLVSLEVGRTKKTENKYNKYKLSNTEIRKYMNCSLSDITSWPGQ